MLAIIYRKANRQMPLGKELKMPKYLIALLLLSLARPVHAGDIDSLIKTCWQNHAHPEMSDCVAQAAADNDVTLLGIEADFLMRLSRREEDPEYIAKLKKAFKEDKQAFQIYRKKKCAFYAAVAASGNGAEDMRLACVAVLNAERSDQLEWVLQNWE